MEDQAAYKTARPNERDVYTGARFMFRGLLVTVQSVWQHGGVWWVSFMQPCRYTTGMVGYTKQTTYTSVLNLFTEEIQYPGAVLTRPTHASLTR
jgi:hypothetical protein